MRYCIRPAYRGQESDRRISLLNFYQDSWFINIPFGTCAYTSAWFWRCLLNYPTGKSKFLGESRGVSFYSHLGGGFLKQIQKFHRNSVTILVPSPGPWRLQQVFEENLQRVGRMVALLDHWDQPAYLSRMGRWKDLTEQLQGKYLPIYLSIYLSIYLPIYLSTYLSIYLSIYLPIYLPIYLSIYLSIYLPIYLSIYLPIYLSAYLSIYLSFYLSIYLSIYLYLSLYTFIYL